MILTHSRYFNVSHKGNTNYFNSHSHLSLHLQLLRTNSYMHVDSYDPHASCCKEARWKRYVQWPGSAAQEHEPCANYIIMEDAVIWGVHESGWNTRCRPCRPGSLNLLQCTPQPPEKLISWCSWRAWLLGISSAYKLLKLYNPRCAVALSQPRRWQTNGRWLS